MAQDLLSLKQLSEVQVQQSGNISLVYMWHELLPSNFFFKDKMMYVLKPAFSSVFACVECCVQLRESVYRSYQPPLRSSHTGIFFYFSCVSHLILTN